MKKLFLDFVFWKSPGKTHFHSVDCSISVHSVLRTPCTEKEQSTPWKWFYLTFSRKLHKKLLFLYFWNLQEHDISNLLFNRNSLLSVLLHKDTNRKIRNTEFIYICGSKNGSNSSRVNTGEI